MSRIPDELIDQVRDAADLVGIIGQTVELKKSGADWRGPCPFHGGTHRNFAVVPRKGVFYCFVCHEKGDVFSYLMKRFGMDYPTAIREVASRVGITIPDKPQRQGPDPHEPLFSAVAAAHEWFTKQLRERPDASGARTYLESREIPSEAVALHGLGYAPAGNDFFAAMGALGVSDRTLLEAGLAVQRDDGSVHPRFRKRLLFPIHDMRGRVVAFGGRILGDGEPKYLNSPETPIFHKGGMLYNLHHARQAIRRAEQAIVVEGYFDVLRLVLAGVEHCVAPLGTSLTEEQAQLLTRYTETVVILYDSDQAGLKATFRAADVLLARKLRARVATMPDGEDPDTLVRKGGAAAIEPLLADAVDVLERKLQLLERRGWLDGVDHRRDALDRLLPTLRAAADPLMRELYVGRVAERLSISRDVLEAEVTHAATSMHMHAPAPARQAPPERTTVSRRPVASSDRPERSLLRLLLLSDEWRLRARDEVQAAWFQTEPSRAIFEALVTAPVPLDREALIERVAPDHRGILARLMDDADREGPPADTTYAGLCEMLEARVLLREFDALWTGWKLAASPEEAAAMRAEAEALRTTIQTRFPLDWTRRFYGKKRPANRRRPSAPGA